jgi:SAM-dependent methyltransferase
VYLAQQNGVMARKYAGIKERPSLEEILNKIIKLGGDYRSLEARKAFREVVENQRPDALCLSVGGGPARAHPKLVNLNIGLFPNVDVVGDAYSLPYTDDSIDAVYCEAVLEHLEYPEQAVTEMFRTLRANGQVFAATPFLQMFHPYPNHYQNFTLEGHQKLFEHAGFRVLSSGVCVGPTFALSDLIIHYTKLVVPTRILNRLLAMAVGILVLPIRPLDLLLNRHPAAHVLASTTYVHAIKPA